VEWHEGYEVGSGVFMDKRLVSPPVLFTNPTLPTYPGVPGHHCWECLMPFLRVYMSRLVVLEGVQY
jgi:hypothetical protein